MDNLYRNLIILSLCIHTCYSADTHCESLWNQLLHSVTDGSQANFEAAITPFALATKTSYTYPALKDDIQDWTFTTSTNNTIGMHAVVYQV